MATIQRREQTPGTVTYRVRWWADNKQRSKTFDNAGDAKRFKAVLEGDMVTGNYYDPKSGQKTVASFAEEWLGSVNDLRANSKAILTTCVRIHVVPEFGTLPLSAVTHAHVQKWANGQISKHSASLTRKNVFALRRIMDGAKRHGYVKDNPADGISLPSPAVGEQRYLTKEEIYRLAESVRPRYKAMVLAAAFGGFRFGELCALRRKDINVLKGTVRVRETLVDVNNTLSFGPPKTRSSVRTVTLPGSIMAVLVHHLDNFVAQDTEALVFTFANGNAIRRAWFRVRVWLPATTKAGVEGLRFHDLRHTFVALWVDLGRNAKEVSKVAGHSSVAFTLDRYGHLYEKDDSDLADRLDALLA